MLNLLLASECRTANDAATDRRPCDEWDVHCVAGRMVEHVVCTAERLLASDPGRYYLYKRPTPQDDEATPQHATSRQQQHQQHHSATATASVAEQDVEQQQQLQQVHYPPKGDPDHCDGYTSSSLSSSPPTSSASSMSLAAAAAAAAAGGAGASTRLVTPGGTIASFRFTSSSSGDSTSNEALSLATERRLHDHYEWPTIGEFQYNEAVITVRDYIGLWRLTPATLYEMIVPAVAATAVPPLGVCHVVEAHFSKPTAMCPNPLAVAKVHFHVHVSQLLPHDYPVMVTYRFEGYRQLHYALGERCRRSMRFQRFYIDAIIATKLAFYAELCELRHPSHERSVSRSQLLLKRKPSTRQTQQQQQRSFLMASMDMDLSWTGPTGGLWDIGYDDMNGDYD